MDDKRACGALDSSPYRDIAPIFMYDASPLVHGVNWNTDWWPGGSGIGGAGIVGAAPSYDSPYPVGGVNGRLAIIGFTRDEYGSPLPLATVKMFRTSDDSLQDTFVSDDNGLYTVTTPFADDHYLVVYKAGPPDICGTTINTLAPG